MSTAQPPHREEDSPQATHATSQQAVLTRSRDRVLGEKKAWAKKARRRHSVSTTKFSRHEGDKLPGRSTSFGEEIAEGPVEDSVQEAAESTPEDSAEEVTEEANEEIVEDSAEETAEGSEDSIEDSAEDPKEGLGEYVDELSRELDALDELEESEEVEDEAELVEDDPAEDTPSDESDESDESEEPENEPPVEPLLVDGSSENEQAEDLAEELKIERERIPREQPDLQARSWGAVFKSDASARPKGDKLPGRLSSEHPKQPSRPKPTKREKPAPTPAPKPVERPKPTKRERPKPTSAPTSAPAPESATPARQKPTKRKKPAPHYRYIKSPSLEQAFRNLLRLDAGAAWRATRIPLVAFFLCFALLALAIADQAPAIDSFNATINALIHGTRGLLDSFFVAITMLGDFLPMTALCLVVCAILAIARKWDGLAFFATNVILAVVCVQALKLIFAVPRPGAETLVPIPGSFSFPSAHSFCSLIVFGMIGLLIFRALNRKGAPYNVAIVPGIILVIFAILIGISRIYVGVHWPSDVLGGWLLAGMWLPFASALYTVGARKR